MHAKDFVVDDAGEGEIIEHISEVVPDCRVAVFATAFGVEAVGLSDAAGFVVAADEVHALRVAEFEADEEGDRFDAEEAAVDVVAWKEGIVRGGRWWDIVVLAWPTEEEVVGVWTIASNLEYLNHVEELAMNVSNDRDR